MCSEINDAVAGLRATGAQPLDIAFGRAGRRAEFANIGLQIAGDRAQLVGSLGRARHCVNDKERAK